MNTNRTHDLESAAAILRLLQAPRYWVLTEWTATDYDAADHSSRVCNGVPELLDYLQGHHDIRPDAVVFEHEIASVSYTDWDESVVTITIAITNER